MPLANESKTIVFGPVTGASVLRSGYNHYLFHVRAGYSDEALRIVQQLRQMGTTLSETCADLTLYPQKLINVRMAAGFDWKTDPDIAQAKKAAEEELADTGRVLLRPSGTEPLLRVMVEGRDGAQVSRLARAIADTVENACSS